MTGSKIGIVYFKKGKMMVLVIDLLDPLSLPFSIQRLLSLVPLLTKHVWCIKHSLHQFWSGNLHFLLLSLSLHIWKLAVQHLHCCCWLDFHFWHIFAQWLSQLWYEREAHSSNDSVNFDAREREKHAVFICTCIVSLYNHQVVTMENGALLNNKLVGERG